MRPRRASREPEGHGGFRSDSRTQPGRSPASDHAPRDRPRRRLYRDCSSDEKPWTSYAPRLCSRAKKLAKPGPGWRRIGMGNSSIQRPSWAASSNSPHASQLVGPATGRTGARHPGGRFPPPPSLHAWPTCPMTRSSWSRMDDSTINNLALPPAQRLPETPVGAAASAGQIRALPMSAP